MTLTQPIMQWHGWDVIAIAVGTDTPRVGWTYCEFDVVSTPSAALDTSNVYNLDFPFKGKRWTGRARISGLSLDTTIDDTVFGRIRFDFEGKAEIT